MTISIMMDELFTSIDTGVQAPETHRQVFHAVDSDVIKRIDRICEGKPPGFKPILMDTMFRMFVERLESAEGKTLVNLIERVAQ